MKTISIVFSFFNEQESLKPLFQRLAEMIKRQPYDFELIFINDASTDKSVAVIQEQSQLLLNASVELITMSRRFGVEECFLAGMTKAKGDGVIIMYTDLQDPPEIIDKMIKKWEDGYDIVHTKRRTRLNESYLKIIAAKVAYRIIHRMSDIYIPIDTGEFKFISRRALNEILKLKEHYPYLRGLIPWVGFNQVSIDYDMQPRHYGSSKIKLFGFKAWSVFLSGVTSFSFFPIYLILMLGILGIVLSVCLFILWIFNISNVSFIYASLMLWFWGSLMTAIGFVGSYVMRISADTRGRPHYIIEQQIKIK